MTAERVEHQKVRELRPCPDDFDVIFVEQGRLACESWYRCRRTTVNRWLEERGKQRLIRARADYVASKRKAGEWITRASSLVKRHSLVRQTVRQRINDRRRVPNSLARAAARHLRISRHGGWIVSPAADGEWFLGTRRVSAAELVDFAKRKGFDADSVDLQDEGHSGDY